MALGAGAAVALTWLYLCVGGSGWHGTGCRCSSSTHLTLPVCRGRWAAWHWVQRWVQVLQWGLHAEHTQGAARGVTGQVAEMLPGGLNRAAADRCRLPAAPTHPVQTPEKFTIYMPTQTHAFSTLRPLNLPLHQEPTTVLHITEYWINRPCTKQEFYWLQSGVQNHKSALLPMQWQCAACCETLTGCSVWWCIRCSFRSRTVQLCWQSMLMSGTLWLATFTTTPSTPLPLALVAVSPCTPMKQLFLILQYFLPIA